MERYYVKCLFVLFSLLSVPAFAGHDCRIKALNITGHRREGSLILRAQYIGYDGGLLSQRLCPDQNPPTWGTDRDIVFLDDFGFKAQMEGDPGEVVTVSIATIQNPDKEFWVEKRFRFRP